MTRASTNRNGNKAFSGPSHQETVPIEARIISTKNGNSSESPADEQSQNTLPTEELASSEMPVRHIRITILGTGFSGLGMAIQLKRRGYDDFLIVEQATDVGGTWRDNTYPGCACDIPSHLYSFSFASNPQWSHMFSPQNEIQDYLRHCMERFGLRPYIQWNTTLQEASWDEEEQRWQITTSRGKFTSSILILGNGPLSEPSLPLIPGIERFAGTLFHSSRWDHNYDLTDKRVAVIGTGASAIQFVPRIQPQVKHLTLFQRTPPWITPRLDHPIAGWKKILFRFLPFTQQLIRTRMYWQRELLVLGFSGRRSNILKTGERIGQKHLATQIADPELRTKLTPHYSMGCKRILLSDDFYPALTQPNVELVTDTIAEVREHSIVTHDGREHEIDTLICATGFHVTDTNMPQHVHGRDGQSLGEQWHASPSAYLGTTVANFPNLFLLIGPNTGLGHNSMVFMIESQISYILDCLHTMDKQHIQSVEIQSESQENFQREIQKRMAGTVWTSGCASWYLDANGRNTTLWPGFTFEYRRRTRHFDPEHYNLSPTSVQ